MRANGPRRISAFHPVPTLSSTSCLARCIVLKATKDRQNRLHDCEFLPWSNFIVFLFGLNFKAPSLQPKKGVKFSTPGRGTTLRSPVTWIIQVNTAGGISVLVILEQTFICCCCYLFLLAIWNRISGCFLFPGKSLLLSLSYRWHYGKEKEISGRCSGINFLDWLVTDILSPWGEMSIAIHSSEMVKLCPTTTRSLET